MEVHKAREGDLGDAVRCSTHRGSYTAAALSPLPKPKSKKIPTKL